MKRFAHGLLAAAMGTQLAPAQGAQPASAPLQALPALEVAPYMGTWYQMRWSPNPVP